MDQDTAKLQQDVKQLEQRIKELEKKTKITELLPLVRDILQEVNNFRDPQLLYCLAVCLGEVYKDQLPLPARIAIHAGIVYCRKKSPDIGYGAEKGS